MADRPPVSAEDVPQSVVEAAVKAWPYNASRLRRTVVEHTLPAALAEYERLGYCLVYDPELDTKLGRSFRGHGFLLVPDNEATVERMAKALMRKMGPPTAERWSCCVQLARAALTAAQGGEG